MCFENSVIIVYTRERSPIDLTGSSKDGAGSSKDGAGSSKDGAGSSKDGAGSFKDGAGFSKDGAGSSKDGAGPSSLKPEFEDGARPHSKSGADQFTLDVCLICYEQPIDPVICLSCFKVIGCYTHVSTWCGTRARCPNCDEPNFVFKQIH